MPSAAKISLTTNRKSIKLLTIIILAIVSKKTFSIQYAFPATAGYTTAVAPLTMSSGNDTFTIFSGNFSNNYLPVSVPNSGTYTVTINPGATLTATGVGVTDSFVFFTYQSGTDLTVINNGTISAPTPSVAGGRSYLFAFNTLTSTGNMSANWMYFGSNGAQQNININGGTYTGEMFLAQSGQHSTLTFANAGNMVGNVIDLDGWSFGSRTIRLNGTGNITGNMNLSIATGPINLEYNSSGRITGIVNGNNVVILNIGNNGTTVNYTVPTNMTNMSGFTATNGTLTISNADFSNINSVTTASTGRITLTRILSGGGTITNAGIIDINIANALSLTGTLTNSGTLNVNNTLTRNANSTNTGTIPIASGITLTNQTGNFQQNSGSISGAGNFTNNATFSYAGGSVGITGTFTNNGSLNISAPFTKPTNFTNTGSIYITSTGSFSAGIVAGNLFIGKNSSGTNNANNFSTSFTNTLTALNVYNTSTVTTTGAGSITGNVYMLGTSTLAGSNISGSILTIGKDSTGATDASTNFAATQAISTFPTISVQSGTFRNNGFAITGVNTAFVVVNGAIATINTGGLTGSATALNSSNSGTINLGSTFNLSGFTNNSDGVFDMRAGATNSGGLTNNGSVLITGANAANSGTLINNLNINDGGGILTNSGTITFATGSSSNAAITNISGTITTSGANATNSGSINNLSTMNKTGSGLLTNTGTITFGTGSIHSGSITNNSTGNLIVLGANASNSGTITNNATMSNSGSGLLANTGTIDFSTGSASSANINNTSGTLQISGADATNTGNITNSNAITKAGSGLLTNNGTITFATGSVSSADITNNSTLSISGANATNSANLVNNATLSKIGSGVLTNTGTITFATGSANGADITNSSGTLSISGANATNSGVIVNTSTLNKVGSGLLTNTGTVRFGTNSNSSADINNTSGTINVTGANATSSGSIVNNAVINGSGALSNTNSIVFDTGSNNSCAITNQSNASLSISGSSINTGTITNYGQITLASTSTGAGNFTNSGGTINVQNGASTTNSITNTSGTLNAPVTATLGVITGTGTVVVDSTAALGVTSYTNSGNHNVTITGMGEFGKITSSGPINVNNAHIIVNAPNSIDGSFAILTGSSISATNTIYTLPETGQLFSTWSHAIVGNSLIIAVSTTPFTEITSGEDQFAENVAAVLDAIAANITNEGQAELISYFRQSTSESNLVDNLNQMVPNVNSNVALYSTNQAVVSRASHRNAARANNSKQSGISSGNICPDIALWGGAIGSISKQKQNSEGLNTGYRLRSAGGVFGIDLLNENEDVYGIAGSWVNSNIYEMTNNNYNTNNVTYYGIVYGTNYFKNFSNAFFEYVAAGGTGKNRGYRAINIDGSNLAVRSSYRNWNAGCKFSLGNFADWADTFRFSHLISMQYAFLHQPDYSEFGSVAALNVKPNANQNILNFGTGFRLSLPGNDPWVTGSREIRVEVSYDVIQPGQNTYANFVVGSPSFLMVNSSPSRFAVDVGFDFSLCYFEHFQIQFNYDYQYRYNFYDHVGALQIKFIF